MQRLLWIIWRVTDYSSDHILHVGLEQYLAKSVPMSHTMFILLLLLLSWRARQATAYMGDKNVPKRWGNPPDSGSGGICLSLVIVDSHFIDWGTTQGRLSLPAADILLTIVKRLMMTNDNTLSSCSRFSDYVVGFTGQKTQPCSSTEGHIQALTQGLHNVKICLFYVCTGCRLWQVRNLALTRKSGQIWLRPNL